jgi:hypothetical protein
MATLFLGLGSPGEEGGVAHGKGAIGASVAQSGPKQAHDPILVFLNRNGHPCSWYGHPLKNTVKEEGGTPGKGARCEWGIKGTNKVI